MTKLKISSFSPVFTCLTIESTFIQFFTSTALMFFFIPLTLERHHLWSHGWPTPEATQNRQTKEMKNMTTCRSSRTTTIILYVPTLILHAACMYHSSQTVSESEHVFSSKIIWFCANSPSSTNMIRKFPHFVLDETWSSLTKPYLFQVTINFRQWQALNSTSLKAFRKRSSNCFPTHLIWPSAASFVTETKQPASLRQHSPTMNFWKLKRNKVLFEGYVFWFQVFALEDFWTKTSVF